MEKRTLTRGTRRTGLCLPFNANGRLQAAAARHSEEDHSAFVSNYLSVCSGRKHTGQIRTNPIAVKKGPGRVLLLRPVHSWSDTEEAGRSQVFQDGDKYLQLVPQAGAARWV